MAEGVERRLAAVLALDVVAYTGLMERDEEGTHVRVRSRLQDCVRPITSCHHGTIIKFTGDGALIVFTSVIEAVLAAVEIQRNMVEQNDQEPLEERLDFRIGINLGDVMFDEGDIYGDGVNIAIRLEGLANRGGICISQAVYDHIKNKVDVEFEAVGNRRLKNIAQPVFLYQINWRPQHVKALSGSWWISAAIGRPWQVRGVVVALVAIGFFITIQLLRMNIPDDTEPETAIRCEQSSKPSIAVLPFNNFGNDTHHENIADGMTSDITTDLAQISDLFVVAANSSFRYKGRAVKPQEVARDLCVRYVLEGSIQKISDEIRVNAQLIEANTGRHLWAERYDREAAHFFAVQNEISRRILQVVGPIGDARGKLREAELDRLARTPTSNLDAYDHFLKGIVYFDKADQANTLLARNEFIRAIELDPKYAKAMAKLTWTFLREHFHGWVADPKVPLRIAKRIAMEAVELAPGDASTHHALGSVNLFLRKHDVAIQSYRRSVELNPNGADLRMHLGWALTFVESPDEGLEQMEEAFSRNPYFPDWYLSNLAWAHFVAHRYDRAIEALERRASKPASHYLMSAAIYHMAGEQRLSSEAMHALRRELPDYTLETAAASQPFKNSEDLEHYLNALRGAGLR